MSAVLFLHVVVFTLAFTAVTACGTWALIYAVAHSDSAALSRLRAALEGDEEITIGKSFLDRSDNKA